METYKIVRGYLKHPNRHTIKTGLTLAQAREHCRDPETSSSTAQSAIARKRTQQYGPWFDGYTQE